MFFFNKMKKLEPNDPCWCGSGKKYKKCHWLQDCELDTNRREGFKILPRSILYSAEEIEKLRAAGALNHAILDMIASEVKEGVSTEHLDNLVREFTYDHHGIPACLDYEGFPKSCCTSINEVVCHGIPHPDQILKDGDIINIDCTTILNGYYGDSSRMYSVGNVPENAKKLVDVAKECLEIGLKQVKPYGRLNDIGDAIEPYANEHGCSIVRDLCGHGIGREFHDEPEVVHYAQPRQKGVLMVPGMVFTIEPMVNEGTWKCKFLRDGWTVITADKKLSAQWEHTLVVTETGYEILT